MLNRNAEKVLKCIIKKSDGNLDEMLDISCSDFNDKRITGGLIPSVCRQLNEEGYIGKYYPSYDEDGYVDLFLKHKGYAYFDNKRTKLFRLWFPIVAADLISVVALIVAILAYIKQ